MSKTTIQRHYYRNGQLREQIPLRNGQRHGVVRNWHRNGALASEEPFVDGLLHGICRHWDETGRLLGEYEMNQGTGVQRSWHDNGKLQCEISTVRGRFYGRSRLWLRDGTLLSDHIYLDGREVSFETYRKAAQVDDALPAINEKPQPFTKPTEKQIYVIFVSEQLQSEVCREAQSWLVESKRDKKRSLGRFPNAQSALKFVQKLYEAGAINVVAPDIYLGKRGAQFADFLLVEIPPNHARRTAIRKICSQLRRKKLGVLQPEKDIGETHLFLSMA